MSQQHYLLSDDNTLAQILFINDDNDNLVNKKDATKPTKDKIDVNNTKQKYLL